MSQQCHAGCLSLSIEVLCPVVSAKEKIGSDVCTPSKCEDPNYIGVYKTNNVSGQVSSAKCTGKICATVEIGVGQYGAVIVIARVTSGSKRCTHTGQTDVCCQVPNAVCTCTSGVEAAEAISGDKTSKDVTNEVSCDRAINAKDMYHSSGIAVGLYLPLVTACDPQKTTGEEVKQQSQDRHGTDYLDVTRVRAGGGLNVTGATNVPSDDECANSHGHEVGGNGFELGKYVTCPVFGIGQSGTPQGVKSHSSEIDEGQMSDIHLTLVGSDHVLAGLEYVRSKDTGCANHSRVIDEEVTNVPCDSSQIEGTTFVTESLYVAVGVHKVVVDSKVKGHDKVATTANTLG